MERTLKVIEKTDIALFLCENGDEEEQVWIKRLKEQNIPVVLILNNPIFAPTLGPGLHRLKKFTENIPSL